MEVVDPQEAAAVGIGALVPQRCFKTSGSIQESAHLGLGLGG